MAFRKAFVLGTVCAAFISMGAQNTWAQGCYGWTEHNDWVNFCAINQQQGNQQGQLPDPVGGQAGGNPGIPGNANLTTTALQTLANGTQFSNANGGPVVVIPGGTGNANAAGVQQIQDMLQRLGLAQDQIADIVAAILAALMISTQAGDPPGSIQVGTAPDLLAQLATQMAGMTADEIIANFAPGVNITVNVQNGNGGGTNGQP